jgi:hypothetical protein
MGAAERLEAPRPRVRHVETDPREHRAHLGGVPQVDIPAVRHEVAHDVVTSPPSRDRRRLVGRTRSRMSRDELDRDVPVEREPAGGQFNGEQLGRRLRPGDELGQRRCRRWLPGVWCRPQSGPLLVMQSQGQRRPAGRRRRGGECGGRPVRPEIAVRAHRLGRVAFIGGCGTEQVELAALRRCIGVEAVGLCPHVSWQVGVAAVQQSVHRGDVPAGRDDYASGHQGRRAVVSRPPHPAGGKRGAQSTYDVDG